MNFSELFIRRPIMTLLLTISITAFGIQVFRQLPVNDLPAVDYPVIQVSVTYPGASPETMANTCATPLEKQFLQIPGLEIATSTNQTGQSTLVLQFSLDKSLGDAATDVQAAISRAQGFLPTDLPNLPPFRRRIRTIGRSFYIAVMSDTMRRDREVKLSLLLRPLEAGQRTNRPLATASRTRQLVRKRP